MTDVIESQALQVPSTEDLERFETLSDEKKNEIRDQVREMQSVTADVVMRKEGWDILTELYRNANERILMTAQFTIPVLNLKAQILPKLKDPEGFCKSFDRLLTDLAGYSESLQRLYNMHKHKTGKPTDDELIDVANMVAAYNGLITPYEIQVDPLLNSLIHIVKTEYSETLSLLV